MAHTQTIGDYIEELEIHAAIQRHIANTLKIFTMLVMQKIISKT